MVESIAARDICLRKLGARAPEVEIAISARYDIYRDRLDELRRNTSASWARAQRLVVLWAGQPETDDCMLTLAALLPSFQSNDVDLLFKAHPRDPAYGSGAYHALLKTAGIRAIDVTGSTVDEALSAAPNLAVTQFSSVAIEAGFFGIPSLWVLLPDAGGARLEQKKGYAVPPLCLAQGAACATNTESLPTAFGQAVADTDYRLNLMQCFDDYFKVRQRGTPAVLSKLRQLQRDAK
jgi:predicted Fe-Mo cluster-binding NifX family protein